MSTYPKAHLKQWWNGEQVPQKCQGTLLNMLLFSSSTAHAAGSMVPRWIRCHGMESTTKSTTTMLYGEFPCLVMAFGTHVHQGGIEQVYETKVSICYLYSTAGYLIPCRWIENMQKYSILYIQDLRNLLLIERFFTMNLNFCWSSCSELQFDLCLFLICLQNVMNLRTSHDSSILPYTPVANKYTYILTYIRTYVLAS